MKKIYLILFACIIVIGAKATTFTVNIVFGPSGYAYTPSVTTCAIGDQVVIQAQSIHPTAQVDQSTWMANGTTTMTGGWGSKTTTFTYSAVSTGTVYFICQVHLFKGMIAVNATGINEAANNFLKEYNVFPNPATTNVKVGFGLDENATVNIRLLSVTGQEVKVFMSDLNLPQGKYEYNFELPAGIAAGNYFMEVSSGTRKTTKKILVTK